MIRKQGRIGLSDIVVRGEIPPNIKDALNQFVCLFEAESERQYMQYLDDAGFSNIQINDKKYDMLRLLDDIKKRIFAAELLIGLGKVKIDIDLDKTKEVIGEIGECVNSGIISCALIIGDKNQLE